MPSDGERVATAALVSVGCGLQFRKASSGYRMVLSLTGRDLEIEGIPGRILHTRSTVPEAISGRCTVCTGAEHESFLVMPLIPAG